MAKLTLIVDGIESEFADSLDDFCDHFGKNRNILKYGMFEPPVYYKNEQMEYINFLNFSYYDGKLTFDPRNIKIPLNNIDDLKFIIKTPVPRPALEIWDSKPYNRTNRTCYIHLFYKATDSNRLNYVQSITGEWSDLFHPIEKAIIDAGYGRYGISIGIIKKEGEIPQMYEATEFFKNPSFVKFVRMTMILVVKSSYELVFLLNGKKYPVSQVARVPRNFIYRSLTLKNSRQSEKVAQFCRRMQVICFNGGIPIHLMDLIGLESFKSTDFERVAIDFSRSDAMGSDIETNLRHPIENFKLHLLETASEADYRSLFWDILVSKLFLALKGSVETVLYRLASEWSTLSLFPELDDRYIDFACLTKFHEKELPILLIEAGKEPFDLKDNSHKDFSKLLGLLSLNCIAMATELVAKGKKPELARVYGIWIGGHQIQFCVAHPVVTSTAEAGTFQIHTNLSFYPHWKFDLLSQESESLNCKSVCCTVNGHGIGSELETIIAGSKNDKEILSASDFVSNNEEINLDDTSEIGSIESGTTVEPVEPVKLYKGHLNLSVLKKLKVFIETVKARILLLHSIDETHNEISRTFTDQKSGGMMSRSRPSSFKATPGKNQITPASTASPLRRKITKHSSLKELEIFHRLSMFPVFFPRVYSAVKIENETQSQVEREGLVVCYEFEEMISIFDQEIHCEFFINSFGSCVLFAAQCLHGLYLLHKVLGVVHSDISPTNIMFSNLDNTWKITDFNHSMDIEESKRTPRTAGTENYIDPAAKSSGIFTEASDVFSLGQVMFNILYMPLVDVFLNSGEYSEKDPILAKLFSEFESVMYRMILRDPNSRLTVISALEEMFKILKRFEIGRNLDDLAILSIQNIFENMNLKGKVGEKVYEKEKEKEFAHESENIKEKELENIEEQIEKVKLLTESTSAEASKLKERFEKEPENDECKQLSEEFKKVKRTHAQEEAQEERFNAIKNILQNK